MTNTASLVLEPDNCRLLATAALAVIGARGDDAIMVDEHDRIARARIARIDGLAIVEQKASVLRGVDGYLVEDGEKVRLEPQFRLFSLRETHSAKPPDFKLHLEREPWEWFIPTMILLRAALGLTSAHGAAN